ncbi:MAG TPA: orotidine-5'-phosphate decarboxylase [Chloroflexota bacterium]|nr:orotidine-5'-phosphate decarboxylase [Chloroflexota bacterium]
MTLAAGFRERLAESAAANRSQLVVGLDVTPESLPAHLSRDAHGVLTFNRAVVESTADLVSGYKLNFAFFQALGAEGWEVLYATRRLIPRRLLTIADAKLGDIGNSSKLYAKAVFGDLDFDAVTLSPYVGREGLQPFLDQASKGSFILCRTSNRDGSLQDVETGGASLYERVASTVAEWGPNAGLVVGATDIGALRRVRELAPEAPLLVPGVGAQGGNLEATIDSLRGGGPALIAMSRAVILSSGGPDFATAARDAAERFARAMPAEWAAA